MCDTPFYCVCVYTCWCVLVSVGAHACGGQRSISLRFAPLIFLRQSLSSAWSLSSRLGCLAREPQGSACASLSHTGLTPTYPACLCTCRDLNSGPSACAGGDRTIFSFPSLLSFYRDIVTGFKLTLCEG